MRRTLYVQPEVWDLARELAKADGERESGSPLSLSIFVSRLILAEKRRRASPQVPMAIPGVRGGVAQPVDTTPAGWERTPMTPPRQVVNAPNPQSLVAPREPRVQGPIPKPSGKKR